MIWSIAWRNIWRNKLRSLVVILAVTLGLFGTLFIIAMSNGMVEQKIATTIENEISHIQLHNPDFMLDNSIQYFMEDSHQMVEKISAVEGVVAISDRIKMTGMASTAATGTGAIVHGIYPEEERKVTKLSNFMVDGDYFVTTSRSPRIIIGKKLGTKLNAKIGSKIVLTLQNTDGELSYGLFRVTGIYKTSNGMFDEMNVFVERDELASLTGFIPANSTEVAVLLENSGLTDPVTEQIKEMYPELSVLSWKQLQPVLLAMQSMMDQFGFVLLIVILVAMAFGIINTMLMAILERTHELGMLMAVGMNKRRVFLMIMLETLFLTLVGAVVGVTISVTTIQLTGQNGIDFTAWAEGFESWGYSALIYPMLKLPFYIGMTFLVIATGVVSSIFPARKALKLNPAEAIRAEA
jgi:ABC-type lipoprotein release transport system permease subunit